MLQIIDLILSIPDPRARNKEIVLTNGRLFRTNGICLILSGLALICLPIYAIATGTSPTFTVIFCVISAFIISAIAFTTLPFGVLDKSAHIDKDLA